MRNKKNRILTCNHSSNQRCFTVCPSSRWQFDRFMGSWLEIHFMFHCFCISCVSAFLGTTTVIFFGPAVLNDTFPRSQQWFPISRNKSPDFHSKNEFHFCSPKKKPSYSFFGVQVGSGSTPTPKDRSFGALKVLSFNSQPAKTPHVLKLWLSPFLSRHFPVVDSSKQTEGGGIPPLGICLL